MQSRNHKPNIRHTMRQRLRLGHQDVHLENISIEKCRRNLRHLSSRNLPADMDAEKEHRRQRRQAIKAQKALTQPPRLGKLKYEKAPVQVSRKLLQQHHNCAGPCACKATPQKFCMPSPR